MGTRKKKKSYTKPGIVYEKKIETLAAVCDTAHGGAPFCMKEPPCMQIWN